MAIKVWNKTGLTGSVEALDQIKSDRLSHGHLCQVNDDGRYRLYYYNASSQVANNHPDYVQPADYQFSGVWEQLDTPFGSARQLEQVSGLPLSGNLTGFNITKTDDHELTVSKGSGRSYDDTTNIYLEAATTCDDSTGGISTNASAMNHLFVVKVDDGTFAVRAYSSEAGVEAATDLTSWAYIGFWPNNAAGNLIEGMYTGNLFLLGRASEAVCAPALTATGQTLTDETDLIVPDRVLEIAYGAQNDASAGLRVHASDNSWTSVCLAFRAAADDGDTGDGTTGNPWAYDTAGLALIPYNSTREFKLHSTPSGNTYMLVHAVRVHR